MSPSDELMAALGDARIKFWRCPVEGHNFLTDRNGRPIATVEWDGDVAGCLAYGCGRTSTDPVPRGECWCDGATRDGEECTGQCCGPGQCSCSPEQRALATAPYSREADR